MTPFTPLANIDGLSNMYTDFLYEYAPRPTCSTNNINGCGSRFLFCDISHGAPRCASKILLGGNCGGYLRNEDSCYQGVCRNNICVAGTITTTQSPTTTPGGTSDTCLNGNECCWAWAQRGECQRNPGYMNSQCQAECPGGCSRTWDPRIVCEDRASDCVARSNRGECTTNIDWMRENCRQRCGRCSVTRQQICGGPAQGTTITTPRPTTATAPGTTTRTTPRTTRTTTRYSGTTAVSNPTGTCYNNHYCCEVWKAVNYCTSARYAPYMNQHCKPSCGKCYGKPGWKGPACSDLHPSCAAWARRGECTKSKNYMYENCKRSCNQCNLLQNVVRYVLCGFRSASNRESATLAAAPTGNSSALLPVYDHHLNGRPIHIGPPSINSELSQGGSDPYVSYHDESTKADGSLRYYAKVRAKPCY